MIILSGVLVVLAIALLVTGIVTGNTGHEVAGLDGLKLIYVSIGVSIISALCLAIGVFLRRKELFGSADSVASTKRSAATRSTTKAARTAKAKARVGAGDDAPAVPVTPAAATEVPAETSVFVVPGRKRYHLETCRQLAGRDKEELTFVEAREEGFTACTACLPDTALAARAALSDTDADSSPTESIDSVSDTTDLTAAGDDPSLVTRIDLPVTELDTDTELDRDRDAGLETHEDEPAAESPAAAELTEAPESDVVSETETSADTAQFDEVLETEAASEPATERPLARSRSLFEPLDHEDSTDTEDTATTEDATTEDATPDEDLADGPALSAIEGEGTTADRHVEAEPEHAEPVDESPAESVAATETSVTEGEATDEPVDEAEHDSGTPEATDTATIVDDSSPADEAEDEAHRDDADHDDAATAGHPDLPFVRILSGTKRYHRPDCALIEDIAEDADDMETVSPAEAKERGCTPCLVCQPDKDPSDSLY